MTFMVTMKSPHYLPMLARRSRARPAHPGSCCSRPRRGHPTSSRFAISTANKILGALPLHRDLDGGEVSAGLRRRDDFRLARGKSVERRLHRLDLIARHDDRPVAVGMHEIAALDRHAVHIDV